VRFFIAHAKSRGSWGAKIRHRYLIAAKDEVEARRILRTDTGSGGQINELTDKTKPGILLNVCLDWMST
jgi:hypothetical protein